MHKYCTTVIVKIRHDVNILTERTSSHDFVSDTVYHIIRESRKHAHRELTGFLPSSAPGGREGHVDIVISDAAVGHTLVDIVVAYPTCRDLVERAARQDIVAATDAERRKKLTKRIARLGRNLCL